MPVIKFVKEKKEIEVAEGANLRQEAVKAGINVYQGINGIGAGVNKYLNCQGMGTCGTCRVLITKGMENVSPMKTYESLRLRSPFPEPVAALSYIGNEDTMRLACQTQVTGDIEVETGPEFDLFGENFFS